MKPAHFDYKKALTLSEALEAYGNDDERDLRLLAGGQSLVPMMNLRLARPEVLIDLNQIEELDYVADSGVSIEIGAITRLRSVEMDEKVSTSVPLLREAISYVAHTAIRTRGTIGGNVAHADPSAEIPTVLVALDGEIVASSSNGDRTIPAKDFFLGAFFTELGEREIVKMIRIPKERKNSGSAFVEFAPRHGDFAIVGIAAVISQNDAGDIDSVRLVVAGVDGKPLASLRAWRDYFKNAKIFGADVDKDCLFNEDRIKTFYVDQSDKDSVINMWKQIDENEFEWLDFHVYGIVSVMGAVFGPYPSLFWASTVNWYTEPDIKPDTSQNDIVEVHSAETSPFQRACTL